MQEVVKKIVNPKWKYVFEKYDIDRGKDDLVYILKANLIFEWCLEKGIKNEWGELLEDIYAGVVQSIFEEAETEKSLYFKDAVEEIETFSDILEKIPSIENVVPKDDMAYKRGKETLAYPREEIAKASEWRLLLKYVDERAKLGKDIYNGKRSYGSFLLR